MLRKRKKDLPSRKFDAAYNLGEDNRGMPIHLNCQGKIKRTAEHIQAEDGATMDIVGRCELTLFFIMAQGIRGNRKGFLLRKTVLLYGLNGDRSVNGSVTVWREKTITHGKLYGRGIISDP